MRTPSTWPRGLLGAAFGAVLSAAMPASANETAERRFLGADMTLYFDGGPENQILSSQAVLLVYLPATGPGAGDYDPAHNDIARVAQRLSNDIAVVPLKQVWPIADDRARRWIRLMGCDFPLGTKPSEDRPLLYFSFAQPNGRACVVSGSNGVETAQLTEQLLDLEESDCSAQDAFKWHVYNWAYDMNRAQERRGLGLLDAASVDAVLRDGATRHC